VELVVVPHAVRPERFDSSVVKLDREITLSSGICEGSIARKIHVADFGSFSGVPSRQYNVSTMAFDQIKHVLFCASRPDE
jgi:hypothetical protein